MKPIRKVLSNGLRLIIVPMKDNPTVTVTVLVETGSKYEKKEENGLSHFLEHMCFKGTTKRPTAMDIARELDGLGAQSNAFTSHEYTGYYAKGAVKHFPNLVDIIADVYLHSTFPEEEIEKEKGVIVEEINMYEDMPHRKVQDLFMELLYKDTPAGWSITGTPEIVRSLKRENFVQYHKSHYVPSATVVIVSGGINEDEAVSKIEEYFASMEHGEKGAKLAVLDAQDSPAVLISEKKTDQTHFVLGTRTFPITDDEKMPVLSVMATILAGGMSSRLFQKLREELGACYYVRGFNDPFTDHGFMEIAVGADSTRVDLVISEVLKECKRMKDELVSEEELARVKEYLIGNMLLELESSDAFSNFYGSQEILNRPIRTPEEVSERVRKVTSVDIQNLAREIWNKNTLNLAIIGPYTRSEEGRFLKLLEI